MMDQHHDQKKVILQDQPDSPIDLSQLSTRRCGPSDLTARSASESCLAPRPGPSGSIKRRRTSPKELPPLLEHHRSISSAELVGYRTPLPPAAAPLPPPLMDAAKMRCMSESRLASRNPAENHLPKSSASSRAAPPAAAVSTAESAQLEFLLRRTASESLLPSRSGPEGGSSTHSGPAMEMFKRQQMYLQQLLQAQQQASQEPGGSTGSSPSSTSSSSYLSAAAVSSPWLYFGLFGYSQMMQQLQATSQQHHPHHPQVAHHHHMDPAGVATSGHHQAGPSSPAVAASASGSDGEGAPEEEEDDLMDMEEEEEEDGVFRSSRHHGGGKKRSPRALTGKHVRLGTGASQTTLNMLKLHILERKKSDNGGTGSAGKNHNHGVLPAAKGSAGANKNGSGKLKASRAK